MGEGRWKSWMESSWDILTRGRRKEVWDMTEKNYVGIADGGSDVELFCGFTQQLPWAALITGHKR